MAEWCIFCSKCAKYSEWLGTWGGGEYHVSLWLLVLLLLLSSSSLFLLLLLLCCCCRGIAVVGGCALRLLLSWTLSYSWGYQFQGGNRFDDGIIRSYMKMHYNNSSNSLCVISWSPSAYHVRITLDWRGMGGLSPKKIVIICVSQDQTNLCHFLPLLGGNAIAAKDTSPK